MRDSRAPIAANTSWKRYHRSLHEYARGRSLRFTMSSRGIHSAAVVGAGGEGRAASAACDATATAKNQRRALIGRAGGWVTAPPPGYAPPRGSHLSRTDW